MDKQDYVAGFLFGVRLRDVVLIEKQKPDWQKGLWNGVGGKIEEGESPHEAMCREFMEEAGLFIDSWKRFCVLSGEWGCVHFFYATSKDLLGVKTVTNEKVAAFSLDWMPMTVPNLAWLIPMAVNAANGRDSSSHFRVTESC